jgi:uncharacterized membrane protein
MLIAAAAAALALLGFAACAQKPKGEQVTAKDGIIHIDARNIGKGEVRFFRFHAGNKDVMFFAARSGSGDIKTAFDACITCFPHRMGYRQEGDCLVCIYCNTPFHLKELDKGKGNCVPIRIKHRLEGDSILIDQKEVEAGSVWF